MEIIDYNNKIVVNSYKIVTKLVTNLVTEFKEDTNYGK